MSYPWSYCEVAFGVDAPDAAWKIEDSLPRRWELQRIDSGSGRSVAVFRVKGMLSRMDGERVVRDLRRAGAVTK